LPDWFEALNTDFRYQLTVIGQFAQAIVSSEIQNHEFAIRSSVPNVKVSWQVTGVRQDAYAKAHPMVVEQEKEPRVKGYYISPELYGAPPNKQEQWAWHPEQMKRMQERQQQMKEKQAQLTQSAALRKGGRNENQDECEGWSRHPNSATAFEVTA
jgi:trimeric autotransporter adhesin